MTRALQLYEFQTEDVVKAAKQPAVLNASEMGYGKTVFAAALDEIHRSVSKKRYVTLIISPLTGTMNTWRNHYVNQYPELKGAVLDTKKRYDFLQSLRRTDWYDYYVVHWEALRTTEVINGLSRIHWGHIIADECHRAKNRKAQTAAGLRRLTTNFKTALSGTPVTNRPDEYWTTLNWLYPKAYRSYWRFVKEFCNITDMPPRNYKTVLGPKYEALPKLRAQIEPFYIRHLKKEACCAHHPNGVMPWLPDKTHTQMHVTLSPTQRRMYDQMKTDMLAWVGEDQDTPLIAPVVIAKLTRLQQLAIGSCDIDPETGKVIMTEPSAKLDTVMEILEDNPDEQIVVFSQFSQPIKLLEQRLNAKGITSAIFTGDIPHAKRNTILGEFQAGRRRVFAGTIKAGGTGLDLFNASTVVFVDRSWSPAENNQAEDRLWRHGQRNPVQVIDIMASGTVDAGRHQTIGQKWSDIKRLLGDT